MSRLPRLLLAVLLAGAAPVLAPSSATAVCNCDDVSVRQAAERADVVFRGTLVEQSTSGRSRTYSLDVARIYQGRVAETPAVVASPRRTAACGLGSLRVERSYLVFGREARGTIRTDRCQGTGRATPAYVADVERVLGPGNALPRPSEPDREPPQVEFTRLDGSDPPSLTRLAAPGAALVLAGVLGLLVFRRRG